MASPSRAAQEHAYWRHVPSNELWAVTLRQGTIVGACGPLNEHDMTGHVLRHLPYSVPLGAWVRQNRPEFQPASAPARRGTQHDAVRRALEQGTTCLRCTAGTHGATLRKVVDELREMAAAAEVVIAEGPCDVCFEHRSLFRVVTVAHCAACRS
jgi:hypothetical protein